MRRNIFQNFWKEKTLPSIHNHQRVGRRFLTNPAPPPPSAVQVANERGTNNVFEKIVAGRMSQNCCKKKLHTVKIRPFFCWNETFPNLFSILTIEATNFAILGGEGGVTYIISAGRYFF